MSIDWNRLEIDHHKDIKVTGKILLDFRKKIVDQEAKIRRLKDELERLQHERNADANGPKLRRIW